MEKLQKTQRLTRIFAVALALSVLAFIGYVVVLFQNADSTTQAKLATTTQVMFRK